MLLGKFRCEEQWGSSFFRFVLGPRLAAFLKPPLPDFAVAGGEYQFTVQGGNGFVRFYDPNTIQFVREVVLPAPIKGVAYSPCGTRLAVGDWDGVVHLMEMDTLKMHKTKVGASACVAFAPSGRSLPVGLYNGIICSLDPVTLAERGRVDAEPHSIGNDGGIMSLAFSPSEDCLAVGCFGGRLHFFDPNSLTELRSTDLRGYYAFVAYHPAGTSIAVGLVGFDKNKVQLIDAITLSVIREVELAHNLPTLVCIGFSPDGAQLMVASHDYGQSLGVYDSGTLDFLRVLNVGSLVRGFAFASASGDSLEVIQQIGHDQPSVEVVAEVNSPLAHVVGEASLGDDQKTESDEGLVDAIQRSEEEDLQREGRDVQQALLLSKADAWSADGVVLSRLTSHTPDIAAVLTDSQILAEACCRVESASCELRPLWANGAPLLVPTTEEQIIEAGINLKPHNILMLMSDVRLVEQALALLPRRKRPKLKPECHADRNPEPAPAEPTIAGNGLVESDPVSFQNSGDPQDGLWPEKIELVVEHTFLNFRLEKDISEISTPMQSAPPTSGVACSGHMNPHRWRLPTEANGGEKTIP